MTGDSSFYVLPIPLDEGCIVEWFDDPTDSAGGLLNHGAPRRRFGRVSHFRPDGDACIYDADGNRAIRPPESLTVLAPQAEAGWGVAFAQERTV